jgi:hypothetical protein
MVKCTDEIVQEYCAFDTPYVCCVNCKIGIGKFKDFRRYPLNKKLFILHKAHLTWVLAVHLNSSELVCECGEILSCFVYEDFIVIPRPRIVIDYRAFE